VIILRTFLYTLFISLFAVAAQAQVKKDTIPAPVNDSMHKPLSNAVKTQTRKDSASLKTQAAKAQSSKDSASLKTQAAKTQSSKDSASLKPQAAKAQSSKDSISLKAQAAKTQSSKDAASLQPQAAKTQPSKTPPAAKVPTTTFKPTAVKDTTGPKAKSAKDSAALKAKPVIAKIPDSTYLSTGGIRIGLDISRFALLYFQPYRTDVTVQADVRLGQKIYGAIETGWNRTSHTTDSTYSYKGSGIYSTIGIDYDFMKKKETTEQNMLYGGIRYGIARNSYEIPHYLMTNDYWDATIEGSYPKTTITAHWIELVFGLRVEAAKNLFLGWGVREKIMIHNNAPDSHPPIVIPGYGSGTKRSQFDMTYTVSYLLPLYKVKVHVPRDQKK